MCRFIALLVNLLLAHPLFATSSEHRLEKRHPGNDGSGGQPALSKDSPSGRTSPKESPRSSEPDRVPLTIQQQVYNVAHDKITLNLKDKNLAEKRTDAQERYRRAVRDVLPMSYYNLARSMKQLVSQFRNRDALTMRSDGDQRMVDRFYTTGFQARKRTREELQGIVTHETGATKFFRHARSLTGRPPPKGFEPINHHYDLVTGRELPRSLSAPELGKYMPDHRAYERAVVNEMNARHDQDVRHQTRMLDTLRRLYAPPGTGHSKADRDRWREGHPGQAQHLDDAERAAHAFEAHFHDRPLDGYNARQRQHQALLPGASAAHRARVLRKTASTGDPPAGRVAQFARGAPHFIHGGPLAPDSTYARANEDLVHFQRVDRPFELPSGWQVDPFGRRPLVPGEVDKYPTGPPPWLAAERLQLQYGQAASAGAWPGPALLASMLSAAGAPSPPDEAAKGRFPPVTRPQYSKNIFRQGSRPGTRGPQGDAPPREHATLPRQPSAARSTEHGGQSLGERDDRPAAGHDDQAHTPHGDQADAEHDSQAHAGQGGQAHPGQGN